MQQKPPNQASWRAATGHVEKPIVIVGAGIAALVAALLLSSRDLPVIVLERASKPGGKIRKVMVSGLSPSACVEKTVSTAGIDAGPTVFTMRWVFDEIFHEVGASFDDYVSLSRLAILARHAWSETERLDLFADHEQSVDAIGRFAGVAEARGYRAFCANAKLIFDALKPSYITAHRPTVPGLAYNMGLGQLSKVLTTRPYSTMGREIARHFADPRLRQLFGRYATYCGSAPGLAPATLMLIAHVEAEGVWSIEGGMHSLAQAIAGLAQARGATFRYDAHVATIRVKGSSVSGVVLSSGEVIEAQAVVFNGDAAAIGAGCLGPDVQRAVPPLPPRGRSLSALTWAMVAKAEGFPLIRHSVFFSRNYEAEFNDIFGQSRLPYEPTVYVCAQDRDDGSSVPSDPERLLILVNAPATGDTSTLHATEIEQCATSMYKVLERCGLQIHTTPATTVMTTPADFNQLFPATGGALYGRASHGWTASFQRPGSRTAIKGLYLAGGSTHPGPGVPMAALSGKAAASTLLADLASTARSHLVAMRGGMSTASATMGSRGSRSSP